MFSRLRKWRQKWMDEHAARERRQKELAESVIPKFKKQEAEVEQAYQRWLSQR